MIKLHVIVLSGTPTLCCSYECYIVVLDGRPVDSTSYYTQREKIQSAIQSEKKSTGVVLLTLDKDRFYLINDCFKPSNFTSDMLYRRASSAVQSIGLDTNITSFEDCRVSFFIFMAHLEHVHWLLVDLVGCYNSTIVSNYVYEISIGNLQTNREIEKYSDCTMKENFSFSTNQEFKVTFSTLSNLKINLGTADVERTPFEMESNTKSTHESNIENQSNGINRKFVFLSGSFIGDKLNWKRTCSLYNMSSPVFGSVTELTKFTKTVQSHLNMLHRSIIKNLGPSPHRPSGNREYIDLIYILQIKENVGHRYTWDGETDLLFSHWAPGEPRFSSSKNCVHWKFEYSNGKWVDKKWYRSDCNHKGKFVAKLCEKDSPARTRKLFYTSEHDLKIRDFLDSGLFGKLYRDEIKMKQRGLVVSISATMASGYLQKRRLGLYRLKIQEPNGPFFLSKSYQNNKLEQLRPLFHQCGNNKDDQFHHPWGVPLSLVCDGKIDCQSGSDESFCGFFGGKVCSIDLFQCKSGQCVPLEARCDLLVDCQDRSDEVGCEQECQHKECKSGQCLPRSWFHDGMIDCKDGSDEDGDPPVSDICVFICNRTKCVTKKMLNDSAVDCTGPEGPLDETLGALEPFTCTPQDSNSTYLEKWAPKCVLARDLLDQIIGCRDFQHLSHCEKFECPKGYVKCPNSFCIPLVNVKDGKKECEYGEDEEQDSLPDLVNVFQCNPWKPQAVPLSAVCDGRRDCPHGEDELDCGHYCPRGFTCLAGAISSVGYSKIIPLENLRFIHPDTRHLDLSGVLGVQDFFKIYPRQHLRYLRSLMLSRCEIHAVPVLPISQAENVPDSDQHRSTCIVEKHLEDFRMVKNIDLSHNKLKMLSPCSYLNIMLNLEKLNLTHNAPLSIISRESFTNLKMLQFLDLSYTSLKQLDPDVWEGLVSLENLFLKGTGLVSIKFTLPATIKYFNVELTNIADVGEKVFSKVNDMKELRSSTYKLCCPAVLGHNIPKHVCNFEGQAISSCQDLIKELALRVVIWLVGLSTLVGNAVTLLYRLVWEREVLKKPYGLFVTNLGVSDFLMGVYLVIIAIVDAAFFGEYVLYDYTWRHSPLCQAAGVLVTMSSLTSILFISLITVERYLAVRYPYGEVRLSVHTVRAAVLGVWMFGLTAAVLPLMPFTRHWEIFSSNGMCVALPLNTNRVPGQWYGATLFVGIDLILFIFIGVGQGIIYRTIKEKGRRTRKHSNPQSQLYHNQKLQEFTIAKQLSLVVMTDFLCWFPIITMGVLALFGVDMGEAAYRWSALLVLPINSALNPMLYTMPEIRKRWEDFMESRRQARILARAASRRKRLRKKIDREENVKETTCA